MKKISDFFELLVLNNEDELRKFVNANGKAPKPVCPIRFIRNQETETEEREQVNLYGKGIEQAV